MSSDYGSDIPSDDLDAICNGPATMTPMREPSSSQRPPLQEISTNAIQTPPPSQSGTSSSYAPWNFPSNIHTPVKSITGQQHPTPGTTPNRSKNNNAPIGPYRFNFGKHNGKTVDEVPEDYISFLKLYGFPSRHPELKAALVEWDKRRVQVKQEKIPSQSIPFPSSQPTPAINRPMPSRLPSSSQPHVVPLSASQPTPSRQRTRSVEPPLYCFPWGTHKGKTLLEVPVGYLHYLRMQGNIDCMPGLQNAIDLLEQGKRPTAVKAAQVVQEAVPEYPPSSGLLPPSSAPAGHTSPEPTIMFTSPTSHAATYSSQSSSLQSTRAPTSSTPQCLPNDYRLNFGKNTEKKISEVPQDYIDFLKQCKITEERPDLAAAIAEHERRFPPEANYRLTFGKNKGKSLFAVPLDYMQFLKENDVVKCYPDLAAAMRHFEAVTAVTRKPSKPSKKRKYAKQHPITRGNPCKRKKYGT